MAYDEGLAERLREVFVSRSDAQEKKMFGGLAFMVRGHMCCGVVRNELMVRVGKEAYSEALAQPHVREMDFTGRAMKGMVYVEPPGFQEEQDLQRWVERGLHFVETLPDKP